MNNEPEVPITYARDRPKDCSFCYFWGGIRKGCKLGGGLKCFYAIHEDKEAEVRCGGCPYGRASPCIGWCTVQVMNAVLGRRKSVHESEPGKEAAADGDSGREEHELHDDEQLSSSG